MRHQTGLITILLAIWALCGGGTYMGADAQVTRDTLVLAEFGAADILDRVAWTDGVSVTVTEPDPDTGARNLEVRVRPFSEHGNKWPYIYLNDRHFTTPADLTPYSRVVTSVRNVTEGLATVRITMSSKPYNDGGRNLEGDGGSARVE